MRDGSVYGCFTMQDACAFLIRLWVESGIVCPIDGVWIDSRYSYESLMGLLAR